MEKSKLLQKLAGIQTVVSVMDILNIDKKMAIYYIYRLRKEGYVTTKRQSNNRRVYTISLDNKLGGKSYYEIINRHSPIKISTPLIHKIYGKGPSLEETFIYAIKTKSFRAILASLALFKKMNDWVGLYHLAKEDHIEGQVGALYDLARQIMKVRRMSNKFRSSALPKRKHKFEYIVPGLRSKDFMEIERTWKIYLPFNKKDLEEYK
ncbi:hypothetical protein HYU19_00565 [Candidatus Woesearchaeota archaeon]|nr:hypothetical protein [Candidatus Woesearchaeota archaeon]